MYKVAIVAALGLASNVLAAPNAHVKPEERKKLSMHERTMIMAHDDHGAP